MRTLPAAVAAKLPRAAALIAERGLSDTRMEELAEVTGMARATLYYYFTGKEEILVRVLRDMLVGLGDGVHGAANGSGTARERLRAVIRTHLDVMARQPLVCRALLADLGRAERTSESRRPSPAPTSRRSDVCSRRERRTERCVPSTIPPRPRSPSSAQGLLRASTA